MCKKRMFKSILGVLCFVALTGCQSATTSTSDATQTPTSSVDTSATQPFYQTEGDVFSVPTPYVDLQYPTSWQDRVQIDVTSDLPYTLAFSAVMTNGNVPLFDVMLCETLDDPVGEFVHEGKTVKFSVVPHEVSSEELSEEEYRDWCMMCEDINVIISGLVYDQGMALLQ